MNIMILAYRHAILTWNEANALGAGANSGESYGLTETGKKAPEKYRIRA